VRPGALWVLLVLAALLTIVFAALVARHLTQDARRASRTYALVFRGLTDQGEGASTEALLQLSDRIRAEGVPVVVTDAEGHVTLTANLPDDVGPDTARVRAFAQRLDRANEPVVEPSVGTVHFGAPPVRRQLRLAFGLMVASLLAVIATGALAWRSTVRGMRDRVFVAMARESAHQLGTPLSSLAGWIEQLRGLDGSAAHDIAEHLDADYRRLERVSRRFERIGQPPRRETVDVGALATAAAAYFRPRLPALANPVTIDARVDATAPTVAGDALLLEWALEAVVKNSVDALKGRRGRIQLTVRDEPEHVALVIEDDGPGVPAELAHGLFEPGVTTKTGGWGLGLALTKRIVEEGHGGHVTLEPVSEGARFVIRLPRAKAGA
jgi:signal transduction histidine kinase